MSNNLENVTASSKLRNAQSDVQEELAQKRKDYRERMERVKAAEEKLKIRRAEIQEKLITYYKYIQENEVKRIKSNKKAAAEEKAKQQQHTKIIELSEQAKLLEKQKVKAREDFQKYKKYQNYLEDVLANNDSEEYTDATAIISRYRQLEENKKMLQKRKLDLESQREKDKALMQNKKQKKKNEAVYFTNKLNDMQIQLEAFQKKYKEKQDELEGSVHIKSETTKTIGQIRMACQNLYNRCVEANPSYKARLAAQAKSEKAHGATKKTEGTEKGGEGEKKEEVDEDAKILDQLQVIGDCLEDYMDIIKKHKERVKERQLQAQMQASGRA